jgi:hypothetical protein
VPNLVDEYFQSKGLESKKLVDKELQVFDKPVTKSVPAKTGI